MGLRNAFEDMLTERTGRLILAAVQYARDANDRMRVVVDNTVPVSGTVTVNGTVSSNGLLQNSATAGTYNVWYNPNTAYSIDQRELLSYQSRILAENRRQKWSFS
jgi:hypothetical protein